MKNNFNFKDNCYYRLTYLVVSPISMKTSNSICYFKYVDICGNILTTSGFVIMNGVYYNSDEYHINYDDVYEEVNLTEILVYLPTNHPEKILFRKDRINKLLK